MLTIPALPSGYGPWAFKCHGPGTKLIKGIIEELIKTVLVHEKIKKSEIYIDILLKNKEDIAPLHKKFLGKDGPTDVISVEIDNESIKEKTIPTMLGTLIFCWQVIKEDAQELNRDEFHHLAHIVVHGTLHLLGYDHTTPTQQQSMEAKEILILSKLGVPSPYID